MDYKGYTGLRAEPETMKKWLLTRKHSKNNLQTVGAMNYSGYFTTQSYKSDRVFFWIAMVCEAGFLLAVSLIVGGFDWLLSLSAFACVALDLIGAFYHHRKQDEICRGILRYQIEQYQNSIHMSNEGEVQRKFGKLKKLENNFQRRFGAGLIILSAIAKIFGSAILFELPVFTIVLTVIYCFVAWIHINKTGYFLAGVRFYRALNRDLNRYIDNDAIKEIKKRKDEFDFVKRQIDEVPAGVTLKEVKCPVFEDSDIYDSIEYNDIEKKWTYRRWKHQSWDDANLFNFINSKDKNNQPMSDAARAFLLADLAEKEFLAHF